MHILAVIQLVHTRQWRIQKFRKGGGAPERGGIPEIGRESRILGLKSLVLLTFDGKFRAKRVRAGTLPPSKSATARALEKSNPSKFLWKNPRFVKTIAHLEDTWAVSEEIKVMQS
jgi:hypothetical protein